MNSSTLKIKPPTDSAGSEDLPFSQFLRILGKGPKTRRSLTVEEARQAVRMILDGQVTDRQLGAFLLLMRANGESPEELVGFLQELRSDFLQQAPEVQIDLDWSAYAGKWRYPPYFLLAVKLLVEGGYKVLLHGDSGQFNQRTYAADLLQPLGFSQAKSLTDASLLVQNNKPTYLPLETFAPQLREILHLKQELGVRTVFNTLVKLFNPLNAPAAVQGIFHPGVEHLHHAGASTCCTPCNLVFKGEGGEAEIRPDALAKLYFSVPGQELFELKVPSLIERQERPKSWQQQDLIDLWCGQKADAYGEAAVLGSVAAALMSIHLSRGGEQSETLFDDCYAEAKSLWTQRSC